MFKVENSVPKFYSDESRDFQLLCRLCDIVLQSVRHSIECLTHTSNAVYANDRVLKELATKVGFFYDIDEYSTYNASLLLKSFPNIIRYKGSMECIRLILNLFERLANTSVDETYDEDTDVLTIRYEKTSANTLELLDLLMSYVKPTGMMVDYVVYVDASPKDIVVMNPSSVTTSKKRYVNTVSNAKVGYTIVNKETISSDQGD